MVCSGSTETWHKNIGSDQVKQLKGRSPNEDPKTGFPSFSLAKHPQNTHAYAWPTGVCGAKGDAKCCRAFSVYLEKRSVGVCVCVCVKTK